MNIGFHNLKKVCDHRKLKGWDPLTEKQIIFLYDGKLNILYDGNLHMRNLR